MLITAIQNEDNDDDDDDEFNNEYDNEEVNFGPESLFDILSFK